MFVSIPVYTSFPTVLARKQTGQSSSRAFFAWLPAYSLPKSPNTAEPVPVMQAPRAPC